MVPDTIKGIQHIAVKKAALIDALKKNREQHTKDYAEAIEGYRKALIEDLEEKLVNAKENKDVPHYIQLEVPQNHEKDYIRLIGMLEMSVDEQVLITQQEYVQYVMDDWAWKEQFTSTAQAYKVQKAR